MHTQHLGKCVCAVVKERDGWKKEEKGQRPCLLSSVAACFIERTGAPQVCFA